ncbi:hypothetical protein KEM52_001693, partial [Ascosphaera acerosa]
YSLTSPYLKQTSDGRALLGASAMAPAPAAGVMAGPSLSLPLPLPGTRTPTQAAEALREYGQARYRDGDYGEALRAFTEALRTIDDGGAAGAAKPHGTLDIIGLLDARAATYCKLGQPARATADARQMIKRDRADHRGYMRLAHVLRATQRPAKALEVLRYALRTLPRAHAQYAVVEAAASGLARAVGDDDGGQRAAAAAAASRLTSPASTRPRPYNAPPGLQPTCR